jgi:hypothetical protein
MATSRFRLVELGPSHSIPVTGLRGAPFQQGAWCYMTGELQSKIARAQELGSIMFCRAGGKAVDEEYRRCNALAETFQDFYRRRHEKPILLEPEEHPAHRLLLRCYQLFAGPIYAAANVARCAVDPYLKYAEKCAILRAAQQFLEFGDALVEQEFTSLLMQAQGWVVEVQTFMNTVLAEERRVTEEKEAEERVWLSLIAQDYRRALRFGGPLPSFDERWLQRLGLLSDEEIQAVEQRRAAESRASWIDLYERNELPKGIVPFQKGWEQWLRSRDFDHWDAAYRQKLDIAWSQELAESYGDIVGPDWEKIQANMEETHNKRLRLRHKRLGRHCRSRSVRHS